MQSTLRNSFAAAALLSCAAAVLAQPAFVRDRDHGGWNQGWRRDATPPLIVELTPVPGDRIGGTKVMTVSARFADDLSGIDQGSVRLRVDGRDVTYRSGVGENEVRFHDRLVPGRHLAEVLVRDQAGNTARRTWQFDVAGSDRHGYGDEGYRRGGWGWQR